MAGPVLIFDKSTLQGLSLDEAAWLDNSYLSNITPLFFIETLADLEKDVRSGRTPEQVVGILAQKTPDMGVSSNVHHMDLITGELLGLGTVDMRTGRPHIGGGTPTEVAGKGGIMFGPTKEEEAFHRWQNGEFLEIERMAAKAWRQSLSNTDLERVYALFKERLASWTKPKNFDQLKTAVDAVISHTEQENVFRMGLGMLGVDEGVQKEALRRWNAEGRPPVQQFAPYFAYVFSVDMFFYFGIAADLIGRGRASHKVDIAYLYYLPFCMVFSSNDHLHASIAPFFLRDNQTYVGGTELKADLQALDKYYDALPDATKNQGMMRFAFYPPDEGDFLLSQLWDKHMNPKWRQHKREHGGASKPLPNPETSKPLLDAIRAATEKRGAPMKPFVPVNSDAADSILIKRSVRAKKGRWERFPPEVRNKRKNEKGEWEDVPPSDQK